MALRRPITGRAVISLVPLVDVLLILLVFFMVTSTYLDLNMIPVVEKADSTNFPPAPNENQDQTGSTMLIRLDADGSPVIRGKSLSLGTLALTLKSMSDQELSLPIVILPSGRASIQALVSVMEVASDAGAKSLRVVRLEARQ